MKYSSFNDFSKTITDNIDFIEGSEYENFLIICWQQIEQKINNFNFIKIKGYLGIKTDEYYNIYQLTVDELVLLYKKYFFIEEYHIFVDEINETCGFNLI